MGSGVSKSKIGVEDGEEVVLLIYTNCHPLYTEIPQLLRLHVPSGAMRARTTTAEIVVCAKPCRSQLRIGLRLTELG
jgi:hypothetical protein